MRVRSNVEAMRLVDVGRSHVVEEAPRPDGSSTATWERPTNAKGADLALAALRDFDARAGRMVGGVDDRRGVGAGDRPAHDGLGSSRQTPPR